MWKKEEDAIFVNEFVVCCAGCNALPHHDACPSTLAAQYRQKLEETGTKERATVVVAVEGVIVVSE